jgi:serine/threonine-protein kinase
VADRFVGKILDARYKVLSPLGSGGMGSVYMAREIALDRNVAIKVLHANMIDPENQARFEREGAILSNLSHQHIMTFYRFGIAPDNSSYIAIEYLPGRTLRSILSSETTLDWRRATQIAMQICKALEYSHQLGVVHRDLKPENIMLMDTPEKDYVKLMDFGLAKLLPSESGMEAPENQKLTKTGQLVGSINYLSPEQCIGKKPDQRADVYALGCILYESLLGEPPFYADNPMGVMYKHANEKPKSVLEHPGGQTIPPEFEIIL